MSNNEMHVTDCRVTIHKEDDERLKGFASIVLNGQLAICDLKIIHGHKGLFVAMPSRRRRDGTFQDVAHPIVSGLRERIEQTVLEAYRQSKQQLTSNTPAGEIREHHANGGRPPGN